MAKIEVSAEEHARIMRHVAEARVKERRLREERAARARRREALRKYPGATIGELLEAKHANG